MLDSGEMTLHVTGSGRLEFRGNPAVAHNVVDHICKLSYGCFFARPKVDCMTHQRIAFSDPAEPGGGFFDVDEVAGLRAIAKDHRRFAVECPNHKPGNDLARIAFVMAAGAEIVERPHDDSRETVGLMIGSCVAVTCELGRAVDRLRKSWMILVHGYVSSRPVHFGRRNVYEALDPGPVCLGKYHERAGSVDLVILNRLSDGMADPAAGKVKDDVDPLHDLAHKLTVANVSFDYFDIGAPAVLSKVPFFTRRKVVENANIAVLKRIDQVRADETRSSGNQDRFSR